MTRNRAAAGSAGVHQACDDVAGSPAILSLGVSDRAVLLSEVKPQLTLVSEVEVTFITLRGEKRKNHLESLFKWTVSSPNPPQL